MKSATEIIQLKIEEITPYENNPRRNDDAVKYVKESIEQFGFKNPIILDNNNVIIAGHTRLKAAQELGYSEVPVLYADDLSEEQIRAFRLADNKVAEFAAWDVDLLERELAEIESISMDDLGFDLKELEEEAEKAVSSESNFSYEEQYGVIVMCANESEQEEIYNRLTEEGYECKVVAV